MDIRQPVETRYTRRARKPRYPKRIQCRFLVSEADVLGREVITSLVSALVNEGLKVVLLVSGEAMPTHQREVLDVALVGIPIEFARAVFGKRSYVRMAVQRLKAEGVVPGWVQSHPFIIALRGPAAGCFWQQRRLEAQVIERALEYQAFNPQTQIAPWIPACRRSSISPPISEELRKWYKRSRVVLQRSGLLPKR